ncbi:MAG: hypothetical protein FWC16_11995 [Defluviitaleaceae bacterium]|nr:hypothetical protein [Defluviitaleaceae bacterium]MCL2275640.1 hypothetical protein [Defluviitaleaceae bacterium]
MIKAIFFDLDDTLSDHRACEGEALRHVFAGFNIPYTQKVQDIFAPLDYALRNAGIPTIWFNPHNAPNTTDIIPDHTISHLSQLTQPISPHTITT